MSNDIWLHDRALCLFQLVPGTNLALTFDNTDPLFAVVIAPGFYLYVEVADQGPASGSLYKKKVK